MKTEVIVRTKVAEVIGQNWVEWTDEDGNIIEDEKEIAKIALLWRFTVSRTTPNSSAIWRFLLPRAISRSTSSCLGVNFMLTPCYTKVYTTVK